jgi:hypothetical protein
VTCPAVAGRFGRSYPTRPDAERWGRSFVVEEWQSSYSDAFIGDYGHRAGGEVVGEVVAVLENDCGLLFCGSVMAASEPDDRG